MVKVIVMSMGMLTVMVKVIDTVMVWYGYGYGCARFS